MKTILGRKLVRGSQVITRTYTFFSRVSTKVVVSYHSNNLDNEQCLQVSHWKYWWGIGRPDEILVGPGSNDTACPCLNGSLASVEVSRSLGDFLLSLITLGIVIHRRIKYECTESSDGEQIR